MNFPHKALCLLATTSLLFAQRLIAEDRLPYSPSEIQAQSARLSEKVRSLHLLMHENILTPSERQALKDVRIKTPSVGLSNTAIDFYSNTQTHEVFVPVVSLLLIEDLCTAYAWMQVHGFEHSTIDEYLAMIRYRDPSDFPGNRFPNPLKALGIPDDALKNRKVDSLSLKLRNNAWAFILLHEMGHVRHRHVSQEGDSITAAQKREIQADEFALKVMAEDDAVPVGAFLFWQASVHYFMNRGDFDSDDDWKRYVTRESTHPVNADRAKFIATYLSEHAAQFADGPRAKPIQEELVNDIATKMGTFVVWLGNEDRQRGARELAKTTSPETLTPRKAN